MWNVLGERRRTCSVLVGKPAVKISLVRRRSRGDNIKMNLQEQNGVVDSNDVAQNMDNWRAFSDMAMNLRFLKMRAIFD
jgi:hypothetical protein